MYVAPKEITELCVQLRVKCPIKRRRAEHFLYSGTSRSDSAVACWPSRLPSRPAMHLMFYTSETGERVYTLKKQTPGGKPTESAHPARFSPDDKFSKHRLICKKRFGLLPMQKPRKEL